MANVGQTKPATRDRDLPDPCAEVRELRRMVQERDEEIERLQEALRALRDGLTTPKRPYSALRNLANSTLNSGGDQS